MNRSIILLFLAACHLTLPQLSAGLKWDRTAVEVAPSPVDEVAVATFGFINTGDSPATIESTKASCGCTISQTEKATYAPNELGEIQARFNIGGRRGTHHVTITAAIAGTREPTILELTVKIPEPAKITPLVVGWEKGELSLTKSITVESLPKQPLRVLKVTASAPGFESRLETVAEDATYWIHVTPNSTERPTVVVLAIEVSLMGKAKSLQAYAQVRP